MCHHSVSGRQYSDKEARAVLKQRSASASVVLGMNKKLLPNFGSLLLPGQNPNGGLRRLMLR